MDELFADAATGRLWLEEDDEEEEQEKRRRQSGWTLPRLGGGWVRPRSRPRGVRHRLLAARCMPLNEVCERASYACTQLSM